MEKLGYILIRTPEALSEYVKSLDPTLVFFDTESEGLWWGCAFLGISIYDGVKTPAFIAISNQYYDGVDIEEAQAILNPFFSKMNGVAHNAKYDLWVFKQHGLVDVKIQMDTMLALHGINPDPIFRKNLETRLAEDVGWEKDTFGKIVGKKWDKIVWGEEKLLDLLAEYSCEDVVGTKMLYDHWLPKLNDSNLRVLNEIELPLVYTLRNMKERGVRIDKECLYDIANDLEDKIKLEHDSILDEAGCVFNINSSKQKAEVLFDKLGLPSKRVTKGGMRSTDAATLKELRDEGYAIANRLLLYSRYNKLLTTYAKGIPNLVDYDGRLRADFNSTGAVTGRMSSSKPNLQNQPNDPEFPIRKSFIPAEGHLFQILDWSQIELRVMAHASGDKELSRAFLAGEDIHQFVADQNHITRSQAKTVNFGVMYGMGSGSLAGLLHVSEEEAEVILHSYHTRYRGFSLWKREVEKFAITNGYVKNIFGRTRMLPDAASYGIKRSAALRQAVNTLIQGAAADIMKMTLVKLEQVYAAKNLQAYPLLVVHDEYLIEVAQHVKGRFYHLEEAYDTTVNVMENYIKLRVPVVADGKVCYDWSQMKDDNFISLIQQNEYFNQYLLSL